MRFLRKKQKQFFFVTQFMLKSKKQKTEKKPKTKKKRKKQASELNRIEFFSTGYRSDIHTIYSPVYHSPDVEHPTTTTTQ